MAIYILFTLASGLVKMSVLLFYRRLSSRAVSVAYRWTLRLTIALIGIYTCKQHGIGRINGIADTLSDLHIHFNLHVQPDIRILGPGQL